jgi:hypothetical protein
MLPNHTYSAVPSHGFLHKKHYKTPQPGPPFRISEDHHRRKKNKKNVTWYWVDSFSLRSWTASTSYDHDNMSVIKQCGSFKLTTRFLASLGLFTMKLFLLFAIPIVSHFTMYEKCLYISRFKKKACQLGNDLVSAIILILIED